MTTLKSIKESVKLWARSFQTVRRVWLFGSWAKNTQHSESDIDLAVEIETSVLGSETDITYWFYESDGICSVLQNQVDRKVHLHHYKKVSVNVYSSVAEHGILIYDKSDPG
jgi:predicted nucleotidyltransferase